MEYEAPLYSEMAQTAVLGNCLLDNDLIRGPVADLSVDDFVGSRHRQIYGAMLERAENGDPFDPYTLAQDLKESWGLNLTETGSFIASLIDGCVPDAPDLIEQHVETMLRLSRLRKLRSLGENLGLQTTESGADPERILATMESNLGCLRSAHGSVPLLPRPDLELLENIQAQKVNWLWEPYLPFGMLAMLSGDPGAGKTFVALAIAAAITVGTTPCTGESKPRGNVLYLRVENSPEHILRPRFDLLGGDPTRFHLLHGSISGSLDHAKRDSVRLSDVTLLGRALDETKAQLAIVDPIQSYLGAEVDAHRSNETRPVMDGLSRLAQEHDCCILLVRHLGKAQAGRAIHRGLGSIDLTGAARTELLAGCSAENPAERALVPVKSNLGQLGPSIGYAIDVDGRFRWTGESALTACAILAPEVNGEVGAIAEARDFLQSALSQGARGAKEIESEAEDRGISKRTLKRAK